MQKHQVYASKKAFWPVIEESVDRLNIVLFLFLLLLSTSVFVPLCVLSRINKQFIH